MALEETGFGDFGIKLREEPSKNKDMGYLFVLRDIRKAGKTMGGTRLLAYNKGADSKNEVRVAQASFRDKNESEQEVAEEKMNRGRWNRVHKSARIRL